MENINTTWVVIANSAHAKIFRLVKFPKIEPLAVFEHPESRLHAQDLVSSRPGRNFQSGGTTRHAYQPMTDPKLVEAEKFAKLLGDYLSTVHLKGEFSRLYLIASPAFLGLLRTHIKSKTREAVIAEIAKDMTEHTTPDIEHQLAAL